ncbi:MAG: hypothetical protein Q9187_009670 [Circinaria calcarea]
MNVVDRTISRNSLPSLPEGTLASARPSDTVSISNEAIQASQTALASTSADQAPDEIYFVAQNINNMSQMINNLKSGFKPDNIQNARDALGEEGVKAYLEDTSKLIISIEQSLTRWNQYVTENYGAVGSLPAKQEDGTWSQGPFSLSYHGDQFGVHVDSDGRTLISKNASSFPDRKSDNDTQRASDVSSADAVLQTLKSANVVDYRI